MILAAVVALFAYAYWLTALRCVPSKRARYRRRDDRPVYGRRPLLADGHTRLAGHRW